MSGTTASPAHRDPSAPSPVNAYPVKSANVPPFDGAGMTTAQIMNILHRLDPGAVAEAGAAYTNLGHELAVMAAGLTRHAQTLAQNWTGSAARAAMASFQQLHDQTSALASQAAQTGSALTWLGVQVLPKFQQIGGLGAALGASGASAAQARQYITALSSYLVTANAYLPDQIGGAASLLSMAGGGPNTGNALGLSSRGGSAAGRGAGGRGAGRPGASGPANRLQAAGRNGVAGGTGPATGMGSGSGSGASLPVSGARGNMAAGTAIPAPGAGRLQSGTPAPAVSRLQSATPVSGGAPGAAPAPVSAAASASAGPGTADLGAGAFSPVPVIPGLAGAGGGRRRGSAAAREGGDPVAGTRPGGETAASSAVITDGPGAPGSGDSAGRSGLGGVPMAGGVPGQSEKERARRVWAYEDENVWGLPAGCVPPLIEGG